MPTYQYRCTHCGESFEQYQSFTDDPLTTCPLPAAQVSNGTVDNATAESDDVVTDFEACGGEVRKVFGNVAITFKGSGFYRNDSRPSSGKSGAGEKSDSSDSSSSSDTSSKSESSAKSDAKSSDSKGSTSKSASSGSSDSSSSLSKQSKATAAA